MLADGLAPFDGSEDKMPASYVSLSNEIFKKWQYRDLVHLTREQILLFGATWGCLKTADARRKYLSSDMSEWQQKNILINKYSDKDKVWLLKTIHQHPGIRHKDLAKQGHKSPSQLTQLIGSIANDKIVTYNYAGREKFYFLSDQGDKLYRELTLRQKTQKKTKIILKENYMENSQNVAPIVSEIVNRFEKSRPQAKSSLINPYNSSNDFSKNYRTAYGRINSKQPERTMQNINFDKILV